MYIAAVPRAAVHRKAGVVRYRHQRRLLPQLRRAILRPANRHQGIAYPIGLVQSGRPALAVHKRAPVPMPIVVARRAGNPLNSKVAVPARCAHRPGLARPGRPVRMGRRRAPVPMPIVAELPPGDRFSNKIVQPMLAPRQLRLWRVLRVNLRVVHPPPILPRRTLLMFPAVPARPKRSSAGKQVRPQTQMSNTV